MSWIKFSEKEPELRQEVLIVCKGRTYSYWLGIYADFNNNNLGLGKPKYWLNIPSIGEEDENKSS